MNKTQVIYSQIRFLTRLVATLPSSKYLFAAVRFVGAVDQMHFVKGEIDEFGIFYPWLSHEYSLADELSPAPACKATLNENAYQLLLYQVAAKHLCVDLQPIVDVIDFIDGARHNGMPLAVLLKVVWIRMAQCAADDQMEDSPVVYILENIHSAQLHGGFRALFIMHQPESEAVKVIYDPGLPYGLESALIRAAVDLRRIGPESNARTHNVSTDGRPGTYLLYRVERDWRAWSDVREAAVEIVVVANIPLIGGVANSSQANTPAEG